MKQQSFLIALLLGSMPAFSAKPVLECHQDNRTDAVKCIDITDVRNFKDGLRISSLYDGGPAGVRKTNFFVATNCQTGAVHLKDKDGVSFAGGSGNETPVLKRLREIVCTANLKAK